MHPHQRKTEPDFDKFEYNLIPVIEAEMMLVEIATRLISTFNIRSRCILTNQAIELTLNFGDVDGIKKSERIIEEHAAQAYVDYADDFLARGRGFATIAPRTVQATERYSAKCWYCAYMIIMRWLKYHRKRFAGAALPKHRNQYYGKVSSRKPKTDYEKKRDAAKASKQ